MLNWFQLAVHKPFPLSVSSAPIQAKRNDSYRRSLRCQNQQSCLQRSTR